MRIFWNAAISLVLVLASVVGPVSAATAPSAIVGQASQQIAVSGQVQDQAGTALGKSSVTIQGNGVNKTVTTDANGAFSFNVAPGLYTINVNHGGYQSASNDVTVVDVPLTINVQLTESNLSNLSVIGRTTANAAGNQARFNISSSNQQTLTTEQITDRDTPNLAPVVNELPGINVNHSATNPNQYFLVHGFSVETKNTLDGHPVSSGTGGTFITQFMQAGIFGGVDVYSGVGLNGPTAGQSGVGTVNLRTPDFTGKDSAFVQGGLDNYQGSFYNVLLDKNFLNGKLSVILGRSLTGYSGPTLGAIENSYTGNAIAYNGTYNPASPTNNLIQFQGDFSNSYNLLAELAKVRYKFSDATSVTGEFIGFYGRWDPQGGAYGQFGGFATIPNCTVGGVASTACAANSLYNAPSAAGLIGNTSVPLYAFYPGSDVRQSQPNFNLDFKTTFKNDTILFRPYAASITRLIDGSNESGTPGDAGAWNAVTNSASCTVAYSGPVSSTVGASGPCYTLGQNINTPGYVVDPNTPHAFGVQSTNAPVCSPTPPYTCFTNPTNQDNAGVWGFGSPYTTLEIDKLAGYTFSYIHPIGANIFNVSVDHYYDDAQSFVNDDSTLVSGCTFTVGGSSAAAQPAAGSLGYQPTCTALGGVYKPSPISVPETFSSITDVSLTAQIQLRDNLEFDLGNYFTHYVINAQQINPNVIAQYSQVGAVYTGVCPLANPTLAACNAGSPGKYVQNSAGLIVVPAGSPLSYIPVNGSTLTGVQNGASHYDPHLGLVFRPTRDLAIRASAGSSISIPYASQVSGFSQRAQSSVSTTITNPNARLLPEEIVSEDLGFSYRLRSGGVISTDIYNIIDHNPWINSKLLLQAGPSPLYEGSNLYQSQQLNGSQRNSQGVDFSIADEPRLGIGYRLTTSINRSYYLNQPAALFLAAPQTYFNGSQAPGIPYAKAYAELQYAGVKNFLLRAGADYEGPNNEYNYNSFVVFDAGLRVGISKQLTLNVTGENLTNVNLNAYLGQAVVGQGTQPVAYSSATGYGFSGSPLGIIQPGFRTGRLSLSYRL